MFICQNGTIPPNLRWPNSAPYLIHDPKLVESRVAELILIPTANTLEKEPTYRLDGWKECVPGLRAWKYPEKELTLLIRGVYWVAGGYGLYNIDREKSGLVAANLTFHVKCF